MTDHILDEVRQHLGQKLAIALDANSALYFTGEQPASVFRSRCVGLSDCIKYRRQVRLREPGPTRACLDLSDAQERGKGCKDIVRFAESLIDRGFVLAAVNRSYGGNWVMTV